MQCNFKAAASLAEYSNGTTRLKSSSKFSPSSAIQSLSMSNCVCTACALVKVASIPRLLTRYLRAGPRKVAVLGGRAIGLDDLGKQYLSSPLDSPVLPNVMMQSPPALGRLALNRGLLEVFVVPLGLEGLVQV